MNADMDAEQIWDEYAENKILGGKAMLSLKKLLRESDDPYSIITLAGDTAAFQLGPEIVPHLQSLDDMVRWNAAGVLFTRFRDIHYARLCYDLMEHETDRVVLGIALAGLGELLPLLEDKALQALFAKKLLDVFNNNNGLPQASEDVQRQMWESAYLAIEAAVGIPSLARAPANRSLDKKKDVKEDVLDAFRRLYNV